jgi:hypothetical protein
MPACVFENAASVVTLAVNRLNVIDALVVDITISGGGGGGGADGGGGIALGFGSKFCC